MINSRTIKDYIEFELNAIAQEYEYAVAFKGELDFYNYDWIKRRFGVKNTPFVLVTNNFEVLKDGIDSVGFRYTLAALPFEKDRKLIENIFDVLYSRLRNYEFEEINVVFRPVKLTYGEDFSEGIGSGLRRFEALFEFEGYATTAFSFKDLEFEFGNFDMPIESFKFEHLKENYVNKLGSTGYYTDTNQKNINHNVLVIETPLTANSGALDLIGSRQYVGFVNDISFSIGGTTIFDNEPFKFDGWTLSSDVNDNKVTAFLYFSYDIDRVEIKINDIDIPILDYAFAMGTVKTSHTSLDSNIGKEIYLGKVRSWAFNIAEEHENDIIEILEEQMFGDVETPPIFKVTFKMYEEMEAREMMLLLDDVVKETKDTGRNYLTIRFVESGEV